jgi:hypothetical protein
MPSLEGGGNTSPVVFFWGGRPFSLVYLNLLFLRHIALVDCPRSVGRSEDTVDGSGWFGYVLLKCASLAILAVNGCRFEA